MAEGDQQGSRRVTIENVNHPGKTTVVDAGKYEAMRRAMLEVLPASPPGLTQGEMLDAVVAHLPDAISSPAAPRPAGGRRPSSSTSRPRASSCASAPGRCAGPAPARRHDDARVAASDDASHSAVTVRIRHADADDLTRLADLYESSVRSLGPQRYSTEQVEAWAGFARDREAFRAKTLGATCLVGEQDGEIVGFVTLEPQGHIGLLYVRGDRGRRGIGRALLARALELADERGLRRITTIAGELSGGLFERFGFTPYEVEESEHGGVVFRRVLMERRL
jgi:putative acetyltransferase